MDLIILGAGGHAKDIIKNIEDFNLDMPKNKRINITGCYDDINPDKKELLGYEVIHKKSDIAKNKYSKAKLICGVGDPVNKISIIKKFAEFNKGYASIIHPSVKQHPTIKIGNGVSVFAGTHLSYFVTLKDHVCINYNCTINHDCSIGEFTTLCPGVSIGGKVNVGNNALFGIAACCSNSINIGNWCLIGAGTVVINNLKDYSIAVGNPQRIIGIRNTKKAVI